MQFTAPPLTVKPLEDNHQKALIRLMTDPVVTQTYMVPELPTPEDQARFFQRLKALCVAPGRYAGAICLEDELIGFFNETEVKGTCIELGCAILPEYHSKGYATLVLKAASQYLFDRGFERILTGAFEENLGSLRVMEKSGLTRLDMEESIEYKGRTHRCIYYALDKKKES